MKPIGPSNKKKADPLAPFKRALTLATRTLAANKSMNVVFGSDAPGFDGKTVRLPQPSRVVTRKEVAVIRGHADSIALMISAHDAKLHSSLAPSSGAANPYSMRWNAPALRPLARFVCAGSQKI